MNSQKHPQAHHLLDICIIGFVAWLWFALTLALCNLFFPSLLAIGAGALFVAGVWYAQKATCAAITFVTIIIAFSLTMPFTPTVFSGRDQGSYSSAAIHLAQEHSLQFSTQASDAFFKIHGEGKALNFPGYDYTSEGKLVTSFPLGYIVWLGSLYSLFELAGLGGFTGLSGLAGLSFANGITLTIFLMTFFTLLRQFVPVRYAIAGLLISLTSLSTVWFSKFTLSENLALTLYIILAYAIINQLRINSVNQSIDTKPSLDNIASQKYTFLAYAVAGYFAFTRIEGFLFLAITFLIFHKARTKNKARLDKTLFNNTSSAKYPTSTIILVLISIALFIRSLFISIGFYKTLAKAALRMWDSMIHVCISQCAVSESPSLWSVLWTYGLIPAILIGCVSVVVMFKKRDRFALIPVILTLPVFFYFIQPNISGDHPWMLRRYIFSLYPALLFTAIVGIYTLQIFLSKRYGENHFFFRKHWYAGILLSILFIAQLPFAVQSVWSGDVSGNELLLKQTELLSQKFTADDLVLVDRLTTGDPFAMIPEPLTMFYGIPSAYFFNQKDFATLDTSAFHAVYLIVPTENVAQYIQHQDIAGENDNSYPTFTAIDTFEFPTQSTTILLVQ